MSIERIKALADVAKQMEEMKKSAIKESSASRKELRFQALKQIQDYFKDVAAIGNLPYIEIPCSIYWLNRSDTDAKLSIHIYDGKVDISEWASASKLEIEDFCAKEEKDFIYSYQDGTGRWNDGYIELIEKWPDIKRLFEDKLESALIEKMNASQKALADFKASYEVAANFKV